MATANAKPNNATVAAIGSSAELLLSLGSGSRPQQQLGSCVTDSNSNPDGNRTATSAEWRMKPAVTETMHGASGSEIVQNADNIYENDEPHYVDMSGNSGYYVTADTVGPVEEGYDDENIYEDIPSQPPVRNKGPKPPRPKPARPKFQPNYRTTQETDTRTQLTYFDSVYACDKSTENAETDYNKYDIDDIDTTTVLVQSLTELHHGDQVAWKRLAGIWHHAIIIEVDEASSRLEIVHLSGSAVRTTEQPKFVSVRREWVTVNMRSKDLFKVNYDQQLVNCFSPETVVKRALNCIDETKYNPFTHNCEHFARWCVTDTYRSVQVEHLPRRIQAATKKFVKQTILDDSPPSNSRSTESKTTLNSTVAAAKYHTSRGVRGIMRRVTPVVQKTATSVINQEEALSDRLRQKVDRVDRMYHNFTGSEMKTTGAASADNDQSKMFGTNQDQAY